MKMVGFHLTELLGPSSEHLARCVSARVCIIYHTICILGSRSLDSDGCVATTASNVLRMRRTPNRNQTLTGARASCCPASRQAHSRGTGAELQHWLVPLPRGQSPQHSHQGLGQKLLLEPRQGETGAEEREGSEGRSCGEAHSALRKSWHLQGNPS